MPTRRAVLLTALTMAACGGRPASVSGGVVAAGQPAALLVWAVAREQLLAWPRRPDARALAVLPAAAGDLAEVGALTSGGPPSDLESIAALRPARIVDYGDADAEHRLLGERLRARLGVDWALIDGTLTRTAEAIRTCADLLDVGPRAAPLADRAEAALDHWAAAPPGPAFYYARGADGLETGFAGALATEVLEGAGWTNVAVGGRDVGRVDRERVAAWDPEALITLSPAFARTAATDPVWSRRRDGRPRRILLIPDLPFGWVDRPPSVNRLLGCAWLADPDGDPAALADLGQALYGRVQDPARRPQWIA
jgi:iron complex transport system substrate-binding protein